MSTGRSVRYGVAMSLDGYIAGPNGEYDWIVEDAEVDARLAEIWSQFDTLLMGRRTYEMAKPMLTRANLGDKPPWWLRAPCDGMTIPRLQWSRI